MTKEELTKLIKETYTKGQIDGITLACEQMADSILKFKDQILELALSEVII